MTFFTAPPICAPITSRTDKAEIGWSRAHRRRRADGAVVGRPASPPPAGRAPPRRRRSARQHGERPAGKLFGHRLAHQRGGAELDALGADHHRHVAGSAGASWPQTAACAAPAQPPAAHRRQRPRRARWWRACPRRARRRAGRRGSTWRRLIASAVSGSCAHSTAWRPARRATQPSAVPHAPAPTMPTCSMVMRRKLPSSRWGRGIANFYCRPGRSGRRPRRAGTRRRTVRPRTRIAPGTSFRGLSGATRFFSSRISARDSALERGGSGPPARAPDGRNETPVISCPACRGCARWR